MKSALLNYVTEGEGPPVILLHGLAASRYDWQMLAPIIARIGYTVYSVDLFGHGDSPKPDDPMCYNASYVLQSLLACVESLDLAEHATLVGHSLGGYLSIKLVGLHPEWFHSLVLINPFISLKQLSPFVRWFSKRPGWGASLIRSIPLEVIDVALGWDPTPRNRFSLEARQQIAIDYKRASPHIFQIPATIEDLSLCLPGINIPTLLLWGDKDLTLKPASFQRMLESMPNATGFPVRGAGHQPHIGQPDLVNQLAVGFLTEIEIDEQHHPV